MTNEGFGLPPVEVLQEDAEQKVARLRAEAAAVVAKEKDAADLLQFINDERIRIASASPDSAGFLPDYDKVWINVGNQKTDLPYVPLGVNGRVIKAPRGEELILPHIYVQASLGDAVENVTVQSLGGYVTRPAHRFQFSVLGKATVDEYKAYLEKQREKAQRETRQAA